MELGEFVFLAKGGFGSLCQVGPDVELECKGQGRRVTLQLIRRQKGDDDCSPQVLATVDRQLTNRNAQLLQNRRGVSNPVGQLQSVLVAGLADTQVTSVSPVAPGVLSVRAKVRLLPKAFSVVVPEPTSRAAAYLDDGAAAAAASASVAGALMDVVEMLQRSLEPGDAEDGEAPVDDPGPSTSNGVRKGGGTLAAAAAATRSAPRLDGSDGGGEQEQHHYSDVRDEIFDIVAPRDWHTAHPNPAGLKCTLFPYQQRALAWMVWRETQPELGRDPEGQEQGRTNGAVEVTDAEGCDDVVAAATAAATAHLGDFACQDLFWRRVELRSGQELWINPYPGGGLRREPPPPPRRQRVGILADEMGLGKTVEVIALMLARPPLPQRPQQQHQGELDGTTAKRVGGAIGHGGGSRPRGPNLIVTPPSILQQWSYEIANHSNLKVLVYDGLRWHRQKSEDKEKERIREAKQEARLAAQREKEAKRQERARLQAERAAARVAKRQAQQERQRSRPAHSRKKQKGLDGRGLEFEETDQEDDEDEEMAGGPAAGVSGMTTHSNDSSTEQQRGTGPSRLAPSTSGGATVAGGSSNHPLLHTLAAAENGAGPSRGVDDADLPLRQKLRVKFAVGVHSLGAGAGNGVGPSASANGRPGPAASQAGTNSASAAHEAGGDRQGAAAAPGGSGGRRPRAPRHAVASDSDVSDDVDHKPPKHSSRKGSGPGKSQRRGRGGETQGNGVAAAASNAGPSGAAARSLETAPAAAAIASTGAATTAENGPGAGLGANAGQAAGDAAGAGPGGGANRAVPSRMELYHRELTAALYAGTPLCPPSCDPQAEASAAVQELLSADVVLTTYTVLKEEVHYSPSNRVLSGLRHEKKYNVPESPLLQIKWHRLVMDEAQMVGGSYSNVVQMASRMEAAHRWCVTGTPIGAGGLDDILGLLCVLKYTPYDDPGVFKHLISEPYSSGTSEGHLRLATLIKPIMWRNSKAVAAQDHPLPRRVLQEAHLRFSAAEDAFYNVILGETRKAVNEMTNHQQQKTQQTDQQRARQPPTQQQGALQQDVQQGERRSLDLIDLTRDGEGQPGAGPGSGAGPSKQDGSGSGATSHKSPIAVAKHLSHIKRRRGQDRGEVLAQVAGAELHQLRLACVHVKLTAYWQKLGHELNLHGHHGAGGGAAAALPAIDDVMARLRDQAQLHLQNTERDLCMALNALAARLEATARKVKALAARKLLQEAASPGGSADAARQAAAAAAGATADEVGGEEATRSAQEPRAKKARRQKDADDFGQNGVAGTTTAEADAAADGGPDGEAQEGDGAGAAAGGGADTEITIHAFRYNKSGKTAAALSADAERMLRECRELLETSWNVGENGIEAAAAAEGAAAAAAAAAGEELEKEIKAASASIRSWRFVQAYTSQLLADLLSTHPQVYAPAGAASDPGSSSAPAGEALTSAPADGADAASSAATAASVRAAELRAYVSTRVTDVRATADKELERARGRLDRIHAAIARLRQQLVEEYETAAAHGLPEGVVPEPRAWLEDVQARLDAARKVEATRRAERQAAAAAGATLGLMGKEVGAVLSSEEAVVTRHRVGLDAAAGSLLVAAALDRLRAADRGLRFRQGSQGQQLEPGPDWTSVLVGGVTMLLPPEGATHLASDPHLAARAGWLLTYPPALGLLRYAVCRATEVEPAEAAGRGITNGFDQMTVLLCERHLRNPIRMLDSRLQDQRKTADHQGTAKLRGHGLVMLLPALEAVRLRIELLRTWKEQNTAELLVEVAEHSCEVVTGEVMEAAQGRVAGMAPLLRLSEEELRSQVAQFKARCEELRHKKSFFQNQHLEATRLRHGGPSATVASAAGPATGSAGRRPPASQLAGATNQREAPADSSGAAGAGPLASASGAGPSGEPARLAQAPAAAAQRFAPRAGSTAHVGVACRTGILACLHAWEQWRGSRAGGQAGGRRDASTDVLDLTGADDMDVVAAPTVAQVGGSASASAAALGVGAATVSAAAARLHSAAGAAGSQATDPQNQGIPEPSPPAARTVAPTAAAGSDAAQVAAANGAAGEAAPTDQVANSVTADRAAAAAAAARARIAAEMAAARARLGLGLGAVDGGIDGGGSSHEEEEGLTCTVCADSMKTDIRLFPCGHYYCATCSDVILGPTGNRRCPTCRFQVRDTSSVVKVGGLSAHGAAAGGAGGGAAKSRLRIRPAHGLDGSGEVDPPEGQHILSVKFEGGSELMCKIGALMRRLVWLRDHRPAEKSLVFSQWSDALQIVERGLRTNDIGYVTLETGRKMRAAMSAFLNDDSCRVFLLSLRQGAAGLTLVRANHVFLLEPSLDPAIEQQAVARVHRIGQTRDVTVTRLLVDGTVEEAVMRMLKEKQQLFMERVAWSGSGPRGVAANGRKSGAGVSTSAAPRAAKVGNEGVLAPSAVPLLEGGEGEEASLQTAAPRQEVLAGADMSYLLNAVLL